MMAARPVKTCRACGGEWDLEACYRRDSSKSRRSAGAPAEQYRAQCVMCDITERNDPTPEERAKRKAQNSIVLHAEKYNLTPTEFSRRFGWEISRMVYDIMHGHENTCPYCYERYASMGNGLTDITLDIVDPKREPYYRTNTRWCCGTCNREKSLMAPHLWDIRCAAWPIYMKRRDEIRKNPTWGLPLFSPPTLLSAFAAIKTFLAHHWV